LSSPLAALCLLLPNCPRCATNIFQVLEAIVSNGEFTPQEEQEQKVLRRSGEAMAIDGEKFGLYLQARLVEHFERLKHQPGRRRGNAGDNTAL
jgi:hypothetical protein